MPRQQPRAQWRFNQTLPPAPAGETPTRREVGRVPSDPQHIREAKRLYATFLTRVISRVMRPGEEVIDSYGGPDKNDRGIQSKFAGLSFNFGFWGKVEGRRDRPYVYLYIRGNDGNKTSRIFNELRAQSGAMGAALHEINPRLELNRWSESTGSPNSTTEPYFTVGMQIDGTIDDPPERLQEIENWMVATYEALKTVMEPVLGEIPHLVEPSDKRR